MHARIIDVNTGSRQQKLHTLGVAALGRLMEGSTAKFFRLVDIDTGGSQQQLHTLGLAFKGSRVEGSPAILVRLIDIDTGSRQQQLHAFAVARIGRFHEGRLSILETKEPEIFMYRQIFYHKDKWLTREMEEFIRVAKMDL